MPRETGAWNRLNLLFDDLLSGRGADPAAILDRISHLLTPKRAAFGLRQFSRRLRVAGPLTTEAALHAACVMRMGGIPAHRIVQFLSLSLPGAMSISQFELVVRFMFDAVPLLPQNLLYDLTQYTYLEQRLLVQRSVELSARLAKSVTPEMLLYLYLLSLREDLSNENVHLILLILRICFPALKIPRTSRGISTAEEGEIAEAWKNAERSARYVEALGEPTPRARREDKAARESASFFLDKYFADGALEKPPEAEESFLFHSFRRRRRTQGIADAGTTGEPAAGGGAKTAARTGARTRPGGAAKKRAASVRTPAPTRAASVRAPAHTSVGSDAPAPRKSRGSPAASPSVQSSPAHGDAAVRPLRLAVPFGLAAVLLLAALVANHRISEWKDHQTRRPAPTTASTQPAPALSAPPSESHVVQEGDSLWKIYRSLQDRGASDTGWKDFLLRVTARNNLRDPDVIYPGNVLTITTEKK